MTYDSDLLRLLSDRGYIHQLTDGSALDALAAKQVVPGYIGFDATAPSLHVGSLVQIMMLRRMQQAGHKPIVVMGGGTTKVGDPSGKDESRRLLDDAGIAANIASIRRVFERFLSFGDGPTDAVLIDNADWLDALDYIPFLRDVGRHFTINRMLSFDSVRLRLDREQPLTFLEFNYIILQAYDFLELSRRVGCRLQLGGSDQWGNIVNGIELARRIDGAELYGLTTPLITTADGAKMGKTAAGAVWLNEDQLGAYGYWQFWRNTDDRDVGRFLRLFTDLSLDEIARLETLEGAEINAAKKALADAATALCRGEAAATEAAETARRTFEEGAGGESLPSLSVSGSIGIVDALVGLGLAASKGEARRLVKGGGARVGGEQIDSDVHVIEATGEPIRVSAGKKHHGMLLPG
ncbi:MAG: tyrosine--tRNA ligase [Janthinobacterium lividum]